MDVLEKHRRDSLYSSQSQQGDRNQNGNIKTISQNSLKRVKEEPAANSNEEIGPEEEMNDTLLDQDLEIPDHQNPFLFPPVLSVLMPHLGAKTLKNCRQVCHLWKDFVDPIFKEKMEAYIELVSPCNEGLDFEKESEEICKKFLDGMEGVGEDGELPFDYLCINVMYMSGQSKMREIFTNYGSRIFNLELLFDGVNFNAEHLKSILLHWCTNLKTLKLYNLPEEIAASTKDIFAIEESVENKDGKKDNATVSVSSPITELLFSDESEEFLLHDQMVYKLMEVCPHLKVIEIDFEDENATEAFLLGLVMAKIDGNITNLDSLIFGNDNKGCCVDEIHLHLLTHVHLRLKRLEILNLGEDVNADVLNTLFHQYKDTLEIFRINMNPETEFRKQELSFPKMNKLKHLENRCPKLQIDQNLDFCKYFPNLKTCILDTDCNDCFGCSLNDKGCICSWKHIILKSSEDFDQLQNNDPTRRLKFYYKPYCAEKFQALKKWFPNVHSLFANICEDRPGIENLFPDANDQNYVEDRSVLVDLFKALSETNVQQIQIEISCQNSQGGPCCRNEDSLGEEEREVETIVHRSKMFYENTKTAKVEKTSEISFPKLKRLNIVSEGCRKMDLGILGDLGILQLVENGPVLSEFTIKYKFKKSTKTAVVFNLQEPFFQQDENFKVDG